MATYDEILDFLTQCGVRPERLGDLGVLGRLYEALVAANRVPGVIESLRSILGEMRTHAENNAFEAYIGADKSFHLALANAAGNSLVTSALMPLLDTMDQKVYREFTPQYYLKDESDLNHVVDLHSEILEAIVQGDTETAFSRMVEHWTRMRTIWEA